MYVLNKIIELSEIKIGFILAIFVPNFDTIP
jgi:hypothetical protein